LNIGIIGTGGIAGSHADSYASLDDTEVVAVCDIDLERAKAFSEKKKIPQVFSDYRELLNQENIQVISICTPNFTHAQISIEGLKAGKAVLCEKPLACSLKEMDDIIAARDKYNGIINSVFQWRYGKGLEMLQSFIRDRLVGKFLYAGADVFWYRGLDYYKQAAWRGTWKGESGGALVTLAIHAIDALLSVSPGVESLYSYVDTLNHKIEVDDSSVTVLKFSDRAQGVVSVTTNNQEENSSQLKFLFENLRVESNTKPYNAATWPWIFKSKDKKVQDEINTRTASLADEGRPGHINQIRDFIECAKKGVSPRVTPESVRKTIEVLTCIYKSGFTGSPVTLPVKKDDPFYNSFRGK
jgi:UDP-N-acetyl-2-amino-2-deoxyglucuronate dehydrogenase